MASYKLRSFENGQNSQGESFVSYSLTVPGDVAELIPEGSRFEVELTDEGILYRFAAEPTERELPSWAKSNGGEAKPKRRGPGRPPGSGRKASADHKRGPGRPRKSETAAPARRGRPPKAQAGRRGPGRPRKDEAAVPQKRGPGRPRKSETASVASNGETPKRGRGRPKGSKNRVRPSGNSRPRPRPRARA